MAGWTVSKEAIAAIDNIDNQLDNICQITHNEISNVLNLFEDTKIGLGAHKQEIQNLLVGIKETNDDSDKVIQKLRLKLKRASMIRKSHIENNRYKGGNSNDSSTVAGQQKTVFSTQSEHKTYISDRQKQIEAVCDDVYSGSGQKITKENAERMLESVHDFTGSRSTPIRIAYNNPNADARDVASLKALDDYINSAPKWKGKLYRGISVSKEQAEDILSGDFVDMLGPSSWSSERSVAERFSNGYKDVRIVFILDDNKSGTSIGHIGSFDGIESEVTAPSGVKYGIDKVKRDSDLILIEVHEK